MAEVEPLRVHFEIYSLHNRQKKVTLQNEHERCWVLLNSSKHHYQQTLKKKLKSFSLRLHVKPFPVSERIWNHLDHAGSLHFSDIQPCSGQTPFPVSAIHSNHRTNENNLNGKHIHRGCKDGDTSSVMWRKTLPLRSKPWPTFQSISKSVMNISLCSN